jgi:hypothetical protein
MGEVRCQIINTHNTQHTQEINFDNVMAIIDYTLNMPSKCSECGDTPKPDEWSDVNGVCIDCA